MLATNSPFRIWVSDDIVSLLLSFSSQSCEDISHSVDRLQERSSLGSIPSEPRVNGWIDPKLARMQNEASPKRKLKQFHNGTIGALTTHAQVFIRSLGINDKVTGSIPCKHLQNFGIDPELDRSRSGSIQFPLV